MSADRKCPICGKPMVEKYRPFCSSRCADVDLNRWLTDRYVIPARDDEPLPENGIVMPDDEEF